MSTATVRLPRQVRAQAKVADEELTKLREQQAQPEPQPQGVPTAEPTPAPETPPVVQQPEPQKPEEAPPQEQTVDVLKADLARSEHRYKTLEGINRAQAQEIKQMKERLQKLETPAPAPAAADPTRAHRHLKPEEVESIGPGTIDLNARIARSEVDPVAERVDRVETRLNDGLHRLFLRELKATHPESDTLNADPDWLLWLGQVDRKTGIPRQDLLDRAVAAQDVERTWAFFEEFKRESGRTDAPAQPPSTVTTTPKAPAPKPAPVSAQPKPTAEPQKRRFSLSYVKKFMKDRAVEAGRGIAMTTEQRNTMSEIEAAEREGRIDMNR